MASPSPSSSSSSATTTSRNLAVDISTSSNDSDQEKIRITVDLVAVARRHLSFLRTLSDSTLLHHRPTLLRSIHRYEDLWMPLISDLCRGNSTAPMLLPPIDVQWVWHCHCLCPEGYREYCASRFGILVEKPAIFDDENEEYASARCREVWNSRYRTDPFDLEEEIITPGDDEEDGGGGHNHLLAAAVKHRELYSNLCDLFASETVYLMSARQRYRCFLHLCKRSKRGCSRLMVPTSDILLMWQTHQSFPGIYWKDMEGMGLGDLESRAVGYGVPMKDEEVEETKRVWEEAFDEPYEKAGAVLQPTSSPSRVFFYWEGSDVDVNRKYKALNPRFMLEVFVFLKGRWEEGRGDMNTRRTSLRLRTMRCHREMKLEKPISCLSSETWQKSWHLYCEFGTRGVVLELRLQGSSCFQSSKVIKKLVFQWNDLLREAPLSLSKELDMQVKAMTSVTPPVQAPYLLRCVPDRVTDDNGAMISDVILRMNGYHPQKGRWLSHTVLDHARRECFVIRIRIAEGFWRRGAETPTAVTREEQIIEVCEGSWSYVAGSIGNAPKKVIGTATPNEGDRQGKKFTWSLSTGDLLTIRWEGGLEFQLANENSNESMRLLRGRKLQYQIKTARLGSEELEKEEEQFVTLVRFTQEYPDGKATALVNWRLFAVEFLPEEDAVLVLLLCSAMVRTISEKTREDVGWLLLRRRVKEGEAGIRDWGSVTLPSASSPYLDPWFWNATEVLASAEVNDTRQPASWYSPADGKEEMYKQAIMPRNAL